MIPIIDRRIEKWLKYRLPKSNYYHIADAILDFKTQYPDHDTTALKEKLDAEFEKITTKINRSIITERVLRSRFVFWASILASLAIVGTIIAATNGLILLLITPATAAFVAWSVSVSSIPISYNQKIIGDLENVVKDYEKEMIAKCQIKKVQINKDICLKNKKPAIVKKISEKIATESNHHKNKPLDKKGYNGMLVHKPLHNRTLGGTHALQTR